MLGLTPEQIAVALAAALAAAFIRGLAGFGMAILLVPVLALAIPPPEAVVTANVLGVLIGMTDVHRSLANAEPTAKFIALLAVLCTPLGVMALWSTDPAVARLLIALVALGAFGAVLLPQRHERHPGWLTTAVTGTASGILTGFAGMPGPPVVPYYLGRRIEPRVARGSMLLVFFATSCAGVGSAVMLRVATVREPLLALTLYPAILLGNWLGHKAFGKVSTRAWRIFVGGVLGAAALGALLKLL